MYHNFLIHLSAYGHLGCFHVLTIVNSAVMNIGVHMSLSILVSSVCMPTQWDCWIIWQFYFQFFKESPHCSRRRKWQPTPVFLLGESHRQRCLVGYSPWGHKDSDTTEQLTHSYTLFSIVAILDCIPTNSVKGFPFLHTLSRMYCL